MEGDQLLIETELFESEMRIMLLFAEGFTPTEQPSLTSGLVPTATLWRRQGRCRLPGHRMREPSLEELIELPRLTVSILEVAKPVLAVFCLLYPLFLP